MSQSLEDEPSPSSDRSGNGPIGSGGSGRGFGSGGGSSRSELAQFRMILNASSGFLSHHPQHSGSKAHTLALVLLYTHLWNSRCCPLRWMQSTLAYARASVQILCSQDPSPGKPHAQQSSAWISSCARVCSYISAGRPLSQMKIPPLGPHCVRPPKPPSSGFHGPRPQSMQRILGGLHPLRAISATTLL